MKKIILVTILSFFTIDSFSQGMYGFDAGIGKTLSYKSYYTPAFSANYLARINRTIYVGGSLSYERYSFLYNSNVAPGAASFGDVINVRQKSSYIFFTPKIDFGIGYRKFVHLKFSAGAGLYMGGSQWTNKYEQIFTLPASATFRSDTAGYNTSYNVPTLIFSYGVGLSERIPTYGYWNIMLSEDFGYIPKDLDKTVPGVKSNYISFTIGIMHKYPQVEIED